MASLKEIQDLVNEAQEKIKEGDRPRVQTVLWPKIKSELGQCTDLTWTDRRNMVLIIHDRLDKYGLQGGEPEPIILGDLKEKLQNGTVKVPQPGPVKWLPG